ncbi:hypothetical protein RM96_31025 [Cupriavidus sp. IDO]|nr:hypothetical protein RM96_31025 [Cupriavidus sp. IDO]
MRTLLYFRLKDIATARLAQTRLGELAGTPARIGGPWFVQRDNQAVDGLPKTDIGQTTYREEAAIAGLPVGALLAALVIYRYGVPAGMGAGVLAYIGAMMLGAMIGWWIGGLIGVRVVRIGLARQKVQLVEGQFLMVTSCERSSKEQLKRTVNELGAVSIDEHDDLLPNFRWL